MSVLTDRKTVTKKGARYSEGGGLKQLRDRALSGLHKALGSIPSTREKETDRQRQGTETDREIKRETETEGQRRRDRERQKQRDRDGETETER